MQTTDIPRYGIFQPELLYYLCVFTDFAINILFCLTYGINVLLAVDDVQFFPFALKWMESDKAIKYLNGLFEDPNKKKNCPFVKQDFPNEDWLIVSHSKNAGPGYTLCFDE